MTHWVGVIIYVVIEFEYIYSVIIPDSKTVKYLYEKGDYQHFTTKLLNIDWSQAFEGTYVSWWDVVCFRAKYVYLLDKYVPSQCFSGSNVTPQ